MWRRCGIRWADGAERLINGGEPSAVRCAVPGSQPVIPAPPEPWGVAEISVLARGAARNAALCSRSTIMKPAA